MKNASYIPENSFDIFWIINNIIIAMLALLAASALFILLRRVREYSQSGSHKNNKQEHTPLGNILFAPNGSRRHYQYRFFLFDALQTALYQKVTAAVPEMIVWGQVSLLQMLYAGKDNARQIEDEIGNLSISILVCRQAGDYIVTVAAIELDDSPYAHTVHGHSDAIKRHALQEAGIPLIVYNANHIPDVGSIRRALLAASAEREGNILAHDKYWTALPALPATPQEPTSPPEKERMDFELWGECVPDSWRAV